MTTLCRLFVYGTLRRGFHHPAFAYISHHFQFVGDGRVRGQLYDMGDYPAAIPTEADNWIVGELYQANSEDEFYWAISQLDDYEGIYPEEGEKALYRREVASIYLAHANEPVNAWIYWYNGDVTGKPFIESGDVLQYAQHKNR